MTRTRLLTTLAALICMGTPHLAAQKTVTTPGAMETATATIQKVDVRHRFVVVRADDGTDIGLFAPMEFKRFDELRVGDRLTVTYYESTVYELKGKNAPPAPPSEVVAKESDSGLPGGTFSQKTTKRVTVKAVDRKAALITVIGPDGLTTSRRVHNPEDLAGVKKGDRIDITYTEAVLASVTRQ